MSDFPSQKLIAKPVINIDDETLEKLIQEAQLYNSNQWKAIVAEATVAERALSFEDLTSRIKDARTRSQTPCDILQPNTDRLRESGLTHKIDVFRKSTYKDSSRPKLETARKHWFAFTLGEAQVSPVRPRVGDDLDAFIREESLLLHFYTYLSERGIQAGTIDGYISMLRGWHMEQVGYAPAQSDIFKPVELSRVQKGGRKLLPSKRFKRRPHPTSANPRMRSGAINTVLDMLRNLSTFNLRKAHEIINRANAYDDLVYQAMAEAMQGGLLRFSEAAQLSIRDFIARRHTPSDPNLPSQLFEFCINVLPLKKKDGEEKCPIPWGPGIGTDLAAGELCFLVLLLIPPEQGSLDLPLFRLRSKPKAMIDRSEFQDWYQRRMQALGYDRPHEFKTHSFRIGGATKLAFLEVQPMQLQIAGRWSSDIYIIYARKCKGKLISLHKLLTTTMNEKDFDLPDTAFDQMAGTLEDYPDSGEDD